MNLEDYKRLNETMEIPSQGTGSSFRELLEKMFKVIIRLEREAVLGMNYNHRVGQNVFYTNNFKLDELSKSLNEKSKIAQTLQTCAFNLI